MHKDQLTHGHTAKQNRLEPPPPARPHARCATTFPTSLPPERPPRVRRESGAGGRGERRLRRSCCSHTATHRSRSLAAEHVLCPYSVVDWEEGAHALGEDPRIVKPFATVELGHGGHVGHVELEAEEKGVEKGTNGAVNVQ